jgi:alpha-tubulin suppressor-like RCC1 family protein
VASGEEFAAIVDGGFHSLGLKFDGSLSAWGLNNCRQCDVPAGNDFVAIARGEYHSLALKSDDDSAAASGLNKYQQLDVPTGADFVAIARGMYHGISAVGEPVVLLLLGPAAVMLYTAGRSTSSRLPKNVRTRGRQVPIRVVNKSK